MECHTGFERHTFGQVVATCGLGVQLWRIERSQKDNDIVLLDVLSIIRRHRVLHFTLCHVSFELINENLSYKISSVW